MLPFSGAGEIFCGNPGQAKASSFSDWPQWSKHQEGKSIHF